MDPNPGSAIALPAFTVRFGPTTRLTDNRVHRMPDALPGPSVADPIACIESVWTSAASPSPECGTAE